MLSSEEIKQKLDITNATIKDLELYKNRTIAQIPDNIKQNIRKLTVAKYMTASGFEKVTSILTRLYVSRYYLEKAYEDPEAFKEQYSKPVAKTQTPVSSATPPKAPDGSIKIDISSDDKSTPSNINKTTTKPTLDQKPTIKINLNSTPKSNQEKISTPTSSTPSTPSVPPAPSKTPPPSSNISL